MIKYHFKKDHGFIKGLDVKGHALFGEYGTDIVCSAVSTALIVTVNAIETLGYKENFYAKVEEGNFELHINQTNDVIEGLLINLEYTLNELAAQYKTYIKNHKEG